MKDEGGYEMTARERILAISLKEKQEKNPEYFEELGIHVLIKKVETSASERGK